MSKQYPLALESWGEDVYILASRGHHPLPEFIEAMRLEYSSWPMGTPEHLYMKRVPDPSGEYICRWFPVDKGCRGAVPVTYSHEDYGKYVNRPVPPASSVASEEK